MPRRAIHHCDPISALSVLNNLMKRQGGSISVNAVHEALAMTNQLSTGGFYRGRNQEPGFKCS